MLLYSGLPPATTEDFDTVYSNSQQEVLLKDDELTRTTVVLLLVLEERSLYRTSIQ